MTPNPKVYKYGSSWLKFKFECYIYLALKYINNIFYIAQCAAVTTHSEFIKLPPHKDPPAIIRACQPQSPGFAFVPPTILNDDDGPLPQFGRFKLMLEIVIISNVVFLT